MGVDVDDGHRMAYPLGSCATVDRS